jgi:putative endonuclease
LKALPVSKPDLPAVRGFYMYVLECTDGSLYAGYTIALASRLACHQLGKASKYTRTRRPVVMRAWWEFGTQREAMQAEWAFKALSRSRKLDQLTSQRPPALCTTAKLREEAPVMRVKRRVRVDNES